MPLEITKKSMDLLEPLLLRQVPFGAAALMISLPTSSQSRLLGGLQGSH